MGKGDSEMTKTKAVRSTKKQLPEAMKPFCFKPGQSGNPAGRGKGTRDLFCENFIKDFMAEWRIGGPEALEAVRTKEPAVFLRVAASIIPKEYKFNDKDTSLEELLEQNSIAELNQLIAGLVELGASKPSPKGDNKAGVTGQSTNLH